MKLSAIFVFCTALVAMGRTFAENGERFLRTYVKDCDSMCDARQLVEFESAVDLFYKTMDMDTFRTGVENYRLATDANGDAKRRKKDDGILDVMEIIEQGPEAVVAVAKGSSSIQRRVDTSNCSTWELYSCISVCGLIGLSCVLTSGVTCFQGSAIAIAACKCMIDD